MNKKKLSQAEVFVIILGVFVFIFLSSVVIFRREWLDTIFYGPLPYDSSTKDVDYDVDVDLEEYPEISVDIVSDGEGKGQIFFDLNVASQITGVELYLEKDSSLNISDFVCNQPFECLFFESTASEFSVVAIVPVGLVDYFEPGEIFVGDFSYSGSGSLFLRSDSTSFVSDVEYPEYNILLLSEKEFLF